MSELLDYKCPACGGALNFDTKLQKMHCPFCDSVFEMSELLSKDDGLDTPIIEADGEQEIPIEPMAGKDDNFSWDTEHGDTWNDENNCVFICRSCGGEIIGDRNTIATECPYCNNPVVMSGRVSGILKPNYVIPFKLDKSQAKQRLKDYIASKKFTPDTFKSENKLNEIKGIYVPYWLFDSDISAAAHYDATRVRTWSDGDYRYTQTSHFSVYRQGDMSFRNIPVDGSTKMPDDLMESIEPFNFNEAVDFQTAYLAGYLADKYDVNLEASIPRANQRIKRSAQDTLASTAFNYSTVVPIDSSVNINQGISTYAFYPVWILNTTYKGKKYTFAMNGQTGKFIGNLPVDNAKIWGLFAGLSVGLTAVLSVLGHLFGMF